MARKEKTGHCMCPAVLYEILALLTGTVWDMQCSVCILLRLSNGLEVYIYVTDRLPTRPVYQPAAPVLKRETGY